MAESGDQAVFIGVRAEVCIKLHTSSVLVGIITASLAKEGGRFCFFLFRPHTSITQYPRFLSRTCHTVLLHALVLAVQEISLHQHPFTALGIINLFRSTLSSKLFHHKCGC